MVLKLKHCPVPAPFLHPISNFEAMARMTESFFLGLSLRAARCGKPKYLVPTGITHKVLSSNSHHSGLFDFWGRVARVIKNWGGGLNLRSTRYCPPQNQIKEYWIKCLEILFYFYRLGTAFNVAKNKPPVPLGMVPPSKNFQSFCLVL